MEKLNAYRDNREAFNIHGSAVLVKTDKGTLLFHLKDGGAPSGDADQISTFGGAREPHIDGRNFKTKELTHEAAKRELMEELSLTEGQIKSISPFGYQSFNYPDNPAKGFSVHMAELIPGISATDLDVTEGAGVIEGTLDEILERKNIFPPIREMLERNRERIEKWTSE